MPKIAQKFFEIFLVRSMRTSEEDVSYLTVMTVRRDEVRSRDRKKDEEDKFFDKFEKR